MGVVQEGSHAAVDGANQARAYVPIPRELQYHRGPGSRKSFSVRVSPSSLC